MMVNEKKDSSGVTLEFQGDIDEDAIFPDSAETLKKIHLDLNQVSQINSCGIREWIKWTKTFSSLSQVVLSNCPKLVIDQINTVDGFLPKGARIHSFKVPYFCSACDSLSSPVFKVEEVVKGGELQLPSTVPCESCKKEAEMDVIPERYFKFLKGTR